MSDYTFTVDAEMSNIEVGFIPTSIYLDGIQTFEYVIQSGVIYFNNMVAAGTVLTVIPPEAIRILDDALVTIAITQVGIHSVFAEPFGSMLFSLNGTDWVKSLTHTYPATIYCKVAGHDPVLDFKCKADIEVVIWRGTDNTLINEDGLVEVNEPGTGGLEYHVR